MKADRSVEMFTVPVSLDPGPSGQQDSLPRRSQGQAGVAAPIPLPTPMVISIEIFL